MTGPPARLASRFLGRKMPYGPTKGKTMRRPARR